MMIYLTIEWLNNMEWIVEMNIRLELCIECIFQTFVIVFDAIVICLKGLVFFQKL